MILRILGYGLLLAGLTLVLEANEVAIPMLAKVNIAIGAAVLLWTEDGGAA